MNTSTPCLPLAAIIYAYLCLPLSAHAAPNLDPNLIGQWRGTVPVSPTGTARQVMAFMPDGTETQTNTTRGHTLIVSGTYTTASGTLLQNLNRATTDGRPVRYHCTCSVKYKISGPTLTLGQSKSPAPHVFHRVPFYANARVTEGDTTLYANDPRIIGHWQAVAELKSPTPSHLDLRIFPDRTATMTSTQAGDTFIGHARVTTRPGILALSYFAYTQNGHPLAGKQTQTFPYTVTATTLSLDDRTSDGPVVFHRLTH